MLDDKILWQNDASKIKETNLYNFISYISDKYKKSFSDYHDFYNWSVENYNNLELFWQEFLDYSKIILDQKYSVILDKSQNFYQSRWFPDAKLNFAKNLLESEYNKQRLSQDPNYPALIAVNEQGNSTEYTIDELKYYTHYLASYLKGRGVGPGDVVAGFIPNIAHAVIAMLATTSLGAVWTACSPDFGIDGVLERFTQVKPKVLLVVDGYFYKNKYFDCLEKNKAIINKLNNNLISVIAIDYINSNCPDNYNISNKDIFTTWSEIYNKQLNYHSIDSKSNLKINYNSVGFNDPVYIMYSSGTTGVPKCIVHGVGGILLEHFKEHLLHHDVTSNDRFFYFTTTSWMMWHWQISALGLGSTIIIYDGAPNYPSDNSLVELIDKYNITLFGASAKYYSSLEKNNLKPKHTNKLASLRTLFSTGSPLLAEQYDYIYQNIKQDVALCSISGGTDIIGCFALGNVMLPIYKEQLQCRSLGLSVKFYNEDGQEVIGQKGELVCTMPFPSMPIYFWGDTSYKKYQSAYFDKFNNIWAHGDYGELTKDGGVIIYGRSDATLNPGGVRIGTAEIYAEVEKIPEVIDCIAVGQNYHKDERIILFVVLQNGIKLNNNLVQNIKSQIKTGASPRHVPALIIQVPELPRTTSGKLVELAVKKTINGEEINNKHALANPESLEYFRSIKELTV